MDEKFTFNGKRYKTVVSEEGNYHCNKCAFSCWEECPLVIPNCSRWAREDKKDVYFVEFKTNFDLITENPKKFAKLFIYMEIDDYVDDKGNYHISSRKWRSKLLDKATWNTGEEALEATLEYLNEEVKE